MLKLQMFIDKLMNPLQNVEGATAIEYGLLASLISVVIIAAATLVGTNLDAVFNAVAGALKG
jgi:pilus assembly protein Flp/PilA